MGKLYFHRALMEPRGLPSFNAAKITRQTSPNHAPIDKRRIKTIKNQLFNPPARALPCKPLSWYGTFLFFTFPWIVIGLDVIT
jgi:hypothetical protein